jgi:hypothetical protein
MRLLSDILKSVVMPLVVAVLTPAALALGSRLTTGDWSAWLRWVPRWVWIIACALTIAWLAALVVKRRKARLRQTGGVFIGGVPTPVHGWLDVGRITYQGVTWVVRLPAPRHQLAPVDPPGPGDVDVTTPPRCPVCGTELEESKSFWWGYNWKCVRCGFSKRNRESFYSEVSRVERVARREFELQMKAQPPGGR